MRDANLVMQISQLGEMTECGEDPETIAALELGEKASLLFFFFFSSRRRHTRFDCDWSSDVCSSDLLRPAPPVGRPDDRHDRPDLRARWALVRARLQVQPPARLQPGPAGHRHAPQRI